MPEIEETEEEVGCLLYFSTTKTHSYVRTTIKAYETTSSRLISNKTSLQNPLYTMNHSASPCLTKQKSRSETSAVQCNAILYLDARLYLDRSHNFSPQIAKKFKSKMVSEYSKSISHPPPPFSGNSPYTPHESPEPQTHTRPTS